MLTGERGLPITSALRFLCVYDDRYSVIALAPEKVTHGMEVSPETAEKGMLGETT